MAGRLNRTSVLVVEDDPVIRSLYRAILTPLGHEITEADDGETALEVALDVRPDVILLDVGLPGISGLEVLRKLKANHDLTQIPVLIVTAWDEPRTVSEALREGASAFVSKPFDPNELTERLDAILTATRTGGVDGS